MTGLTLMNSGGFSYYRLTGNGLGAYHYTEADGLRLVVGLTDTDLNAIKVFGDLAITQSSSLLVVSYITIQDTQDLRQCCGPASIVEVTSDQPLEAAWYIDDFMPPYLVAFDLDLNYGIMKLEFNEPIVATSLQLSGITLYQRVLRKSFHMGFNSTITSGNGTLQTVKIQQGGGLNQELDQIKLLLRGSTDNAGNISISLEKGSAVDMSLRQNELMAVDSLQIRLFKPDLKSPILLYFDLDMDSEELTLVFDEPVNITSFDMTGLRIMSAPDAAASQSIALTRHSIIKSHDDTSAVVIGIGESDMSLIKSLYPLASSVDYVYLEARTGNRDLMRDRYFCRSLL